MLIAVPILVFLSGKSQASDIGSASCSVTAEIVAVGSETKLLDSGREYESTYIDLKIRAVDIKAMHAGQEEKCPVEKGRIYRAIDNDPGTFSAGQKIRADIEAGSAMGPGGAVSFLNWDHPAYADGASIRSSRNGANISLIQSGDKPLIPSKKTRPRKPEKRMRGLAGRYPDPDEKYPSAAISRLNKNGQAGIFNTEGYIAYIAPDSKCGQDCGGGPTSYVVISESPRTFSRSSFQCSARELVVSFPTDVPVWDLFRLGRKYRFTLKIIRLGPGDVIVYHYPMLAKPKIVAEPIGVADAGGK